MFRPSSPTTPHWQRHRAVTPVRFRLFPFRSPLLRESLLLSFPRVTEMFHFTRFPLPVLCIQTGVTPDYGCQVSPFGHPRVDTHSTARRGLSQPVTSFIGSRRQGIHRWPLVAWVFSTSARRLPKEASAEKCSCSQCSSQGATKVASQSVASVGPPRGRSLRTEEKTRYQCINWESLDSGPGGPVTRVVLLRKEVIQPHLPVRLPCYDFTPVANPTFGSSPPNGLGH